MDQRETTRDWWRKLPSLPLLVLVVSGGIVVIVSLTRDVVEAMLQTALLLMGLVASYVWGRESVPGGDARPHARKAYRRMATLYGSLFNLTKLVATERIGIQGTDATTAKAQAVSGLTYVEFALGQHLMVVADAMEDWADVVPEEAAELRKIAEGTHGRGDDRETFRYEKEAE